jgi:uncharacterized RDD family membrane protein YckC
MKCPKCGYLGFERVDRCRNCGYDFSLAQPVPEPELRIRQAPNTPAPLDDLALIDGARGAQEIGRAPATPKAAPRDLPLFRTTVADGEPLITRPSPPRPPLAVRRASEVPRVRAEAPRPPALDLAFEPDASVAGARLSDSAQSAEDAALVSRGVAVVIDLLILAAIDAVVVYFTMQICGLTLSDVGLLPKAPLAAFLFVQNGGYLVAFTAGGQTLGKMAAGIRIVSSESDSALDVGRALIRTLFWLMLAVPAGLGFLTAVFSRDRRGLHDRLAGTRVVR